jgi:hypothetical protein
MLSPFVVARTMLSEPRDRGKPAKSPRGAERLERVRRGFTPRNTASIFLLRAFFCLLARATHVKYVAAQPI